MATVKPGATELNSPFSAPAANAAAPGRDELAAAGLGIPRPENSSRPRRPGSGRPRQDHLEQRAQWSKVEVEVVEAQPEVIAQLIYPVIQSHKR